MVIAESEVKTDFPEPYRLYKVTVFFPTGNKTKTVGATSDMEALIKGLNFYNTRYGSLKHKVERL